MDGCVNINSLPYVNLAQIFEKLSWQERLKIEQVCKNWQYVGKNLSWSKFRIFDNMQYANWPESKLMQIKPLFDRCGRHIRHLSFQSGYLSTPKWTPQKALAFVKMALQVQHLQFLEVKMHNKHLKELSQLLPNLKSLHLHVSEFYVRPDDYSMGLMECLKAMTCLEYLDICETHVLFDQYSFVQFPHNLKYLVLYGPKNPAQLLTWVAKGCKNLKGLRLCCDINENAVEAISQLKSLAYLAVSLRPFQQSSDHIGYIFEALTELRALEINTMSEKVLIAIARYCKKLEHLHLRNPNGVSPEKYTAILGLAAIPNLCSLAIWSRTYSKEQTTEFVNRLIAKGSVQYINMSNSNAPVDPEVLFELLRRCKNIRSIGIYFGRIDSDLYVKICQVVDEIDERDRQQRGCPDDSHSIVEVQHNDGIAPYDRMENESPPYKWLQVQCCVSPPAVLKKWQFGWLSAGKPDWASLYL